MKIFLVSKPTFWANKLFDILLKQYDIEYFNTQVHLDKRLEEISPDWIFFFHWSEIVSKNIYSKYKCVTIHTGNLPEDRGGSPLQNQILVPKILSRVNAIVLQDPVDSGDIYNSYPISLQGSLEDIWSSITEVTKILIEDCINDNLKPIPQKGKVKTFKRKKDNKLNLTNLDSIYDQIRMLDANGYPKTHLIIDGFKLEFSRAKYNGEKIVSDVEITKL